jgi:Protein of unknown function (DUF3237)
MSTHTFETAEAPSGVMNGRQKATDPPPGLPPSPLFDTQELFRATCSDLVCVNVGEVPGGTRLHVTYKDGEIRDFVVPPEAGGPAPEAPTGPRPRKGAAPAKTDAKASTKKGSIVSGSDWVLIRRDAVASFNAQLTFRLEEGFVFDALMSGVVDLAPGKRQGAERTAVYNRWKDISYTKLQVALPTQFEAAGPKENWIARKYKDLSAQFDRYGYLVLHQFIAIGSFTVDKGKILKADLRFVQLLPRDEGGK